MAFSLKSNMRLVYGCIVLTFIMLGSVAIDRLALVSDQSHHIGTVLMPRSRAADEMGDAAREYRISEALRILSISADMASHADGDLSTNAEAFQTKVDAYRALLQKGDDAAAIGKVQDLWNQYTSGNEQMLDFARTGKQAEAADRFRNSASRFYLLMAALNELSDANAERSAADSAAAIEIYQQARMQVIAAVVIMTVLLLVSLLFFETKVWRALLRLAPIMKRLAEGSFDVEVPGAARKDEVGEMARAIQVFKDNGIEVQRLEAEAEAQRRTAEDTRRKNDEVLAAAESQRKFVVSSIARALEELSKGDLTFRLREPFAPEFQKLHDDFNDAMDKLQEAMRIIARGASGIHTSTDEISQASDKLAQRTETQAASLEETAAALNQLTAAMRTSAEGAKQAKEFVAAAKTDAESSGSVVQKAVSAMSEIERSSRQIADIISVIDEIAFQTNLLALNAGVEAARAGEAGKGFAVVASEVRALAQRSTHAAKEIKALISSSNEHVAAGVSLVGETGHALDRILKKVGEINTTISNIAAAAEEQAMGLVQIDSSISQMDGVTQQNAAMAEEGTAASHSLLQDATELASLIHQFQLGIARTPMAKRQPRGSERAARYAGASVLKVVPTRNGALASRVEAAMDENDWQEF